MRLTLLVVVFEGAQVAEAQDALQIEQYRPGPSNQDGFMTRRVAMPKHLAWEARTDLTFAKNPLVLETRSASDTRRTPIVSEQLSLSLAASLGLYERALTYVVLGMSPLVDGPSGSGVSVGASPASDLRLGVRGVPRALRRAPFRVGVEAELTLPTSRLIDSGQRVTGEAQPTLAPAALAEGEVGPVRVDLSLGVRLRKRAQLSVLEVGQELFYAGGLSIGMTPRARAYAEAFGARPLGRRAVRGDAPLEVLLGIRSVIGDVWFGPMVGAGVSSGYGAPTYRVGLSLGYASALEGAESVDKDRDGDRVFDLYDACPDFPEDPDHFEDDDGCLDPDNDRDGVPDTRDGAPLIPEDLDAFEDHDGVPDPDNDHDGVLDTNDRAPLVPEDLDGFEDEDGAPDLDNDGDHVPDTRDGAPLIPEDVDGYADHDGVPELDNDGDGLEDSKDRCPLSPGPIPDQGCTLLVRHDVKQGVLWLAQRVEFGSDSDVLDPAATPVLDEVRAVLTDHPELLKLRVEGHTDGVMPDDYNLDLSMRRAASVVRWLIEHGIDTGRLEAYGCGERRPIDDNTSELGRQENRRVEMHVLDPVPAGGLRSTRGCVEVSTGPAP